MIKINLKKKKYKKAKWLSKETLQITEKRREAKGKGGKEIYTHLNAEFQRLERRNKKAFLRSMQRNRGKKNRKGKDKDLFKKIIDTKGPFHAKMGTMKEIIGMDLREEKDNN